MKRLFEMIQLALLFILITQPLFCFQIEKQFEETTYYLKDICMINSNIGWAVGSPHWDQDVKYYKGTIIKTADGGESWSEQEAGVLEEFRGVCFVDEDNGWAVGANGTILHTDNGGDTWTQQIVATTDEFRGVVFTDVNNGWATSIEVVHYNWSDEPDDWRGSIWHTSDGGQNWLKQTVPDSTSILNRIDFIDSLNGWAVGIKFIDDSGIYPEHAGAFYSTDDGGTTWEEHLSPEPGIVFTGVDMIDDTNTFVVGFKGSSIVDSGTVFRTTDNGESWEQQDPDYTLWDVQFINPDSGYAIGSSILQTLNGGAEWNLLNIDYHEDEGLYGVAVMDDKVISVGDNDFLSFTDNPWGADSTFNSLFSQKYINIHYNFEKVFFIDENYGWVVGNRTYKPRLRGQVILYSDNGGETWESQYDSMPPPDDIFSDFTLNDVYFSDDQNGWVVGNSEYYLEGHKHYGAILNTVDGGNFWEERGTELYEGRSREFVALQFLDNLNGWVLPESKFPSDSIYLVCTENGGESWEWVNTGIEEMFGMGEGDLFFIDSLTGWAAGNGSIIHTNNGGGNWVEQDPSDAWRIATVKFTSRTKGWVGGEGLFVTEDGGTTWERDSTIWYSIGGYGDLKDISFTDSLHGWIFGNNGRVLHTSDGGEQWTDTLINFVTYSDLLGCHFINDSVGWVAGGNGTILKITNNEAYIKEDKDQTNLHAQNTLLQNQPNPFNSKTRIYYTVLNKAFVEISIYNTLGQLVKTLVNEEQQRGNHCVLWDGKDNSGRFVAAGSYYYLLKTEGVALNKKMLLLK
jgi:photosystem II stability/assembly factor-like uncharacterized protein